VVAGFHADAIHHYVGNLSANFERGEGDPNNHQSQEQDEVEKNGWLALGLFHEIISGSSRTWASCLIY
jgi:hypothetical protein